MAWWIYHHVTQDSQALFAFEFQDERELAKKLMKVQGVGAGVSHAIVTTLGRDAVIEAVASGDSAALAKLGQGVRQEGRRQGRCLVA